MKKIITVFGLAALVSMVAWLLLPYSDYYEYAADSGEQCLDGEQYDEEYGVCYFDFYCESEEECKVVDEQYGQVIESLAEVYRDSDFEHHTHGQQISDLSDTAVEGNEVEVISNLLSQMLPSQHRSRIAEVVAESDGVDGILAYVESTSTDGSEWKLAFDPVDSFTSRGTYKNPRELVATLIHEYAHILSLNESQVTHIAPEIEVVECSESEVVLDEGCAYGDAYLTQFIGRYWDIDLQERAHQAYADGNEEDFAYELYQAKQNDFVTEYAATNPVEDFAESFAFFVTQESPVGDTVGEQKMLFFYDYDELVELRRHMRSGVLEVLKGKQYADWREVEGKKIDENIILETVVTTQQTDMKDRERVVQLTVDEGQDLIVIAAPSVGNEYYRDNFQNIIDFDVAYAQAIVGHDDVRIIVDQQTRPYFVDRVDESWLIEGKVDDIWMRDFSVVQPGGVQFQYSPAAYDDDYDFAQQVQASFNRLIKEFRYTKTDYYLDGGNVVDNGHNRAVVTDRFLGDNELTYEQGVEELQKLLNVDQVAIVPADDPVLAHTDGMVMFIEQDVLVVNRYDEPFRTDVLEELYYAFGDELKIIEVEMGQSGQSYDDTIESACGINVNAVVTHNTIYVPHFGDQNSDQFIETIRPHTNKTIVPIDASGVCGMGGSVRCLSWQTHGPIANQVRSVLDNQ